MQTTTGARAVRTLGGVTRSTVANSTEQAAAPILPHVPNKPVAANTVLFREGDAAREVFELVDGGVVKLYKLLPDGRRQVTGFLYPGRLFGMAVHDQYIATAETVGECVVRVYARAALERALADDPALTSRLLASTSEELAQSQDQMLLLGRKTAVERVATFLVKTAERRSLGDRTRPMIDLPMRQSDIADYLGLSSETVSRILQSLRREGTIRYESWRTAILLRMDRLQQLASGALDSGKAYPRSLENDSKHFPHPAAGRQPGVAGSERASGARAVG